MGGFCNEVPGTYVVKYYCQDKSGNGVAKFQTIYNEDHIIPIIHILGHPHMVLEATVTGNYVDDGAVCTDQIDGMISQNVEVPGDVVNLSKAATYRIFYDCLIVPAVLRDKELELWLLRIVRAQLARLLEILSRQSKRLSRMWIPNLLIVQIHWKDL